MFKDFIREFVNEKILVNQTKIELLCVIISKKPTGVLKEVKWERK